jgi:hypothetical protein
MRYEYITKTATAPKANWANRDLVRFHYFNPNGLVAKKIELDKQISALVDQGKCKTGAIIAYGSLDFFHRDELYKLLSKSKVNTIQASCIVRGLAERNQYARDFIAEVSAA